MSPGLPLLGQRSWDSAAFSQFCPAPGALGQFLSDGPDERPLCVLGLQGVTLWGPCPAMRSGGPLGLTLTHQGVDDWNSRCG